MNPPELAVAGMMETTPTGQHGDGHGGPTKSEGAGPGEGTTTSSDQRFYTCDDESLKKLQQEKPWMKNPTYFEKVAVSPSAMMKMMMHCASGVEKGIRKGGNPTEVMGLMLGRPDPSSPTTLIVTDAFPLPIEGFETRVVADDQDVVNHMISLNECLERSRKEKFMGWYHSHPFELGDHSHCFFSQTDLSTQLQWQRAEDPHGNPFVAIVWDPLRSSHTNIPQLKAFRAYPPEYSSPIANECPDGSIQPNEQLRLEYWGSCWNRYYELSVEYYMSSTSRQVLEQLTQNYLWMTTLRQQSNQPEQQTERLKQLQQIKLQLDSSGATSTGATASTSGSPGFLMGGSVGGMAEQESGVSRASGGLGGGVSGAGGGKDWQSVVPKLQQAAVHELTQKTFRQVQQDVFADINKK